MNFITRHLEEFGQNPRTLPREVLVFLVRYFLALPLAMAPMALYMGVMMKTKPFGLKPGVPLTASQTLCIILPAFVAIWFGVCLLNSLCGSWFWLARRFRAPQGYRPENVLRWQSGMVGIVGANNILKVGASSDGLYLAFFWPFAFMQPPVLIPWPEIKAARRKRWLGREILILTVGEPKQATISLQKQKSIELLMPFVAPAIKN